MVEYDEENKVLQTTHVCECGESYSGVVQLFVTDVNENTTVVNIDENGCVDFSEMNDDYFVLAIDQEGNMVAMFEIKNKVEQPNQTPELPEVPEEPGKPTEPEEPVEPNQPSDSENKEEVKEEKEEKPALFPILITIFAVLGVGGAVTYILIKKNKSKKEKGDK